MPTQFSEYSEKFSRINMRREDNILELQFHTDGGPLRWDEVSHEELSTAFREIARDQDNYVIVMTGTGDEFSGPKAEYVEMHEQLARDWSRTFHADGMELMDGLLSFQAPVIGAVNGPALRHCELVLLSDVVLASDTAVFQDSAHFIDGLTPADGIHVATTAAMGWRRAAYFHLMGEVLDAQTAKDYGLVNEVLPKDQLMDRAWEIARTFRKQPRTILRHTRVIFNHELRKRMMDMVGYGMALEGLDCADNRDRALERQASGR